MFRSLVFSTLVGLFGVVQAVAEPSVDAQDGKVIPYGVSYNLHSDILKDDREINIWVPPDFGADRPLAGVIYLLDGGQKQDFFHVSAISQLAALSWTMDTFLVVGIQTKDRMHELTPKPSRKEFAEQYPDAGGAADFRKFLVEEVRPFIEARYDTGTRNVLMGESLAGLFVVDALLTAPEAFDDYIAVSPSLWWDWKQAYDVSSLKPRPDGEVSKRLYLANADEGGAMWAGIDRFLTALEGLPDGAVEVVHRDYSETETHATILHQAALNAFRTLYPMPPYETRPVWWMTEGATPPAKSDAP